VGKRGDRGEGRGKKREGRNTLGFTEVHGRDTILKSLIRSWTTL
jgi:hypothetical protein